MTYPVSQPSDRSHGSQQGERSHTMTSIVLAGEGLLDAHISGPAGVEVVAVPYFDLGGIAVYPRPTIEHTESGQPVEVSLDLQRWLLSLPTRVALPIECDTAQAAIEAGTAFLREDESGRLPSQHLVDLGAWANSWVASRTDAHLLTLTTGDET